YSMSERPGFNFSAGPLQSTNNPLDVAIQDEGWFVVESLDGSQALTRAGNFRVTPEGFLVTGSGLRVVGNGGPITIPPAERISIGNDGTITIKPAGQGAAALAVIDRLQLVNPDNASLDKGRDGLFRLKNDEAFLQDANVKVLSGMLESSNVNVIEAMVNVISLSRNYEMQAKVMATAKETDEASMKLMALG
ncbi:MAG: flagellar basal body rod protein FlgF, partial [Gammaproteobacteria bacterium]|nr:flagellar basal body rod protein FlgF [Gammaproteobacteria bacterium]